MPDQELTGRDRCAPQWIERLQKLPQFAPVVERILKGETALSIAEWLATQPDRGPYEGLSVTSMRKYIGALKLRMQELQQEQRRSYRVRLAEERHEIAETFTKLNSGTKPEVELIQNQFPVLTADEELKQRIDNFNADKLIRETIFMQMKHMRITQNFEETMHLPYQNFHLDTVALAKCADHMQKTEAADKLVGISAAMRQDTNVPMSPAAQRLSELNEVELSLLREVGEKTRTLIRRRLAEAEMRTINVREGQLAPDAGGTGRETPDGSGQHPASSDAQDAGDIRTGDAA